MSSLLSYFRCTQSREGPRGVDSQTGPPSSICPRCTRLFSSMEAHGVPTFDSARSTKPLIIGCCLRFRYTLHASLHHEGPNVVFPGGVVPLFRVLQTANRCHH